MKTKHTLETMTGMGKKINLAGREYLILPINIVDIPYIMGDQSEVRLIILDKKDLEEDPTKYLLYGHNVIGDRKALFIRMINKYVYYLDKPMTEDMLVEHNWSIKEIQKFLEVWIQQISE